MTKGQKNIGEQSSKVKKTSMTKGQKNIVWFSPKGQKNIARFSPKGQKNIARFLFDSDIVGYKVSKTHVGRMDI